MVVGAPRRHHTPRALTLAWKRSIAQIFGWSTTIPLATKFEIQIPTRFSTSDASVVQTLEQFRPLTKLQSVEKMNSSSTEPRSADGKFKAWNFTERLLTQSFRMCYEASVLLLRVWGFASNASNTSRKSKDRKGQELSTGPDTPEPRFDPTPLTSSKKFRVLSTSSLESRFEGQY
jgi:hypothetical protein